MFRVPAETTSIKLSVVKTIDNYFTMIVVDPEGRVRGQFLHGGQDSLIIHEDENKSTPHTISGEIPAGDWHIAVVGEGDEQPLEQEWGKVLIEFNVDPEEDFYDQIYIDASSYPFLEGFDENRVLNAQEKWYKGDLHTHTVYSDGEMTREELMESALNEGLNFIANTDHNVVTTSWPETDDLLVLPGIEVSFYHGHANIINPDRVIYQNRNVDVIVSQEGVLEVMDQEYGPNALVMINHPVLDEFTWQYGKTRLKDIDAVEVINSPNFYLNDEANEYSVLAWDFLLKHGVKLTGVGGSDIHGAPGNAYGEMVGDPATYIYSKELSATSLIKGIKAGHVTVSRASQIHTSFKDYLPGDTIQESSGVLRIEHESEEPMMIEVVMDGEVVESTEEPILNYAFQFTSDYHYIRANIRYADGRIAGFTNPYYYGSKESELTHWQSVIDYLNKEIPETIELYHE